MAYVIHQTPHGFRVGLHMGSIVHVDFVIQYGKKSRSTETSWICSKLQWENFPAGKLLFHMEYGLPDGDFPDWDLHQGADENFVRLGVSLTV